jgi:hypothetical protein
MFGKSFFLKPRERSMDNLAMQILLPLSDNNSFSQILAENFPGFYIDIFESPRLKKSWRIEKKRNRYSLIVPSVFKDAPDNIKTALLKWAEILISNKFDRKKSSISTKKQIKDLEALIYEFIRGEIGAINRRTFSYPQIKFKETRGKNYDLREIFETINKEYFNSEMESYLRWGKANSRTSYHTICNDEKGNSFHLITIAGIYNLREIPSFAIESVMYHEMLHIAFPPIGVGIRRNVHHSKFREMEREFHHYKEWKDWQNRSRKKR